ncbi:hypothetical protein A3Q56_04436, partial [Intoshia linei]
VFKELAPLQKYCVLLVDGVYVKVSLRFRGGHIIGQAYNEKENLAIEWWECLVFRPGLSCPCMNILLSTINEGFKPISSGDKRFEKLNDEHHKFMVTCIEENFLVVVIDNTSVHSDMESILLILEFSEHSFLKLGPYSPMLN